MVHFSSSHHDNDSLASKLGRDLIPKLVFVFLLFLASLVGGLIAGTGLHDPDSCWLLALGRYMFESKALPVSDPFSYTFASLGSSFVLYQWLTELVFYGVYKLLSLKGLVLAASVLMSVSFMAMPLMSIRKLLVPLPLGIALLVLTLVASCFHFLIRPEIFSYLLLFVWLNSLVLWRVAAYNYEFKRSVDLIGNQDLGLIKSTFVLIVLWCNLHTAFVIVPIILILLIISTSAENLYNRRQTKRPLFVLVLCLLAALTASLINPKGIGLWLYLPKLFLSPINVYIQELKPLTLESFAEFTYFPFVALGLVSLVIFARDAGMNQKRRNGVGSLFGLYSLMVMVFSIWAGFQARRLIPFVAIVLLYECFFLLRDQAHEVYRSGQFEYGFYRLFNPNFTNCLVSFGLMSLLGAYLIVQNISSLTLPQGSLAFAAPFKAISHLSLHPLSGRIINDAQYGDLLIWYLPQRPRVFIDTRFDMYGPKLVKDFNSMYFCTKNFEPLLKQYNFDWAFLPRNASLSGYLRSNTSWTETYGDEVSSIFRHACPKTKKTADDVDGEYPR